MLFASLYAWNPGLAWPDFVHSTAPRCRVVEKSSIYINDQNVWPLS